MSIAKLSSGCLVGIMSGEEIEKPILQILGNKRIKSTENSERYRLLVSDGQFLNSFAMLATQLNEYVTDGRLSDNTIVRVDKYITSMVNKSEPGQTKRVLIVLGLEVLNAGSQVGQKIGNPIALTEGASAAAAAAAAAPKPEPSSSASSFNNNKPTPYSSNNNTSMASTQSSSFSGQLTHPINSLSPYQNKWVIKVRVMSKGPMRSWNNAKGEGKLFSMDLMDETGEIRATAFKEQAEKYYDMVEVDKVYYISRGQLKPANKQFNKLKNDYELSFGNDTVMQECSAEELDGMPKVNYNFVQIADLAAMEPNALVDVVAVCREAGDVFRFTAKTSGREMVKREVTLVDSSNSAIGLTLWGADAENFDGFSQPIILVKNGLINEFQGGKTLSIASGSSMKINPDIPEGHKLRGWFDNGGADKVCGSISARTGGSGGNYNTEWLDMGDVAARNMGQGDKPDYYQCRVTVEKAKMENAFYKACPTPDCNKKVVEGGGDGSSYRCEKCNAEFPNFKYRLLLNIVVSDWNTNTWVTCFSDLAEQLLGASAEEVGMSLEHDKDKAEKIMAKIAFRSFVFKMRIKHEFYGDVSRPKTTAVTVMPIKFRERNQYLIKQLEEMTGIAKL